MIRVYTQAAQGKQWLQRYRDRAPLFACVLGFTETGLVPGISAAGATPAARQYTAIADAEFLHNGPQTRPQYPLPALAAGASPTLISRSVVAEQSIPLQLFNAGLPLAPPVPCIDLGGTPARCLSQGQALDLTTVNHLLEQGYHWGQQLAAQIPQGYLIVGECVVGGTTTALAVLTGLGIAAANKVNSSHPICNHTQKQRLVKVGLHQAKLEPHQGTPPTNIDPLHLIAAVGDPMQIAVAGMAIAASRTSGVLLAGGTQMLAVYALIQSLTKTQTLDWQPEHIAVGTTRWVAEDPTGDTVGLATAIGSVPLLATQLNFASSRYGCLRAYEQGYVKEGMGAGGCAIAAHLYRGWNNNRLLQAIETLLEQQIRH